MYTHEVRELLAAEQQLQKSEEEEMSLKILQKQVRDSVKAAFAEGTSKKLRVQLRAYFHFCKFSGLKPIPTTTETLCLYGQFLGRSFRSVESVKNYYISQV